MEDKLVFLSGRKRFSINPKCYKSDTSYGVKEEGQFWFFLCAHICILESLLTSQLELKERNMTFSYVFEFTHFLTVYGSKKLAVGLGAECSCLDNPIGSHKLWFQDCSVVCLCGVQFPSGLETTSTVFSKRPQQQNSRYRKEVKCVYIRKSLGKF